MRALLQRVSRAEVRVDGQSVGAIGKGILVFAGVAAGDGELQFRWVIDKIRGLRIFDDPQGRMNLSVEEVGGAILLVSQFTLFGECRKGRRPDFTGAAPVAQAGPLFERFVELFRQTGLVVETGTFRAMMDVELVNDGPVTLLLENPGDFPLSKR